MNERSIWEQFLNFEKKSQLFDIQDSQGTYVWDIIRYDVYVQLLWRVDYSFKPKKVRITEKASTVLLNIFSVMQLLCLKKKYFFFLSSRNKMMGKHFDQNAFSAMSLLPKEQTLLMESYKPSYLLDTVYRNKLYDMPKESLFRYLVNIPQYDFTYILDLLEKEFELLIRIEDLKQAYERFYFQKWIYRLLFKKIKVEKVYLTQNGIQKGLIAAAKELDIIVYEFQHGIVDVGHIAYSYPHLDISSKVYLPHKIASLSNFWFKDCYLPDVCVVPTGNDFFYIKSFSTPESKQILVVSADVFGLLLKEFLQKVLDGGILSEYTVNFKLHPNQFHEYEMYCDFFHQYNNVTIIKNEFSISQLLEKCEVMLTIQSTAVYEGLQAGRKVLILEESSYKRHSHVFGHPNVCLVKTIRDLVSALKKENVRSDDSLNFFEPFDSKAFLKEFVDE